MRQVVPKYGLLCEPSKSKADLDMIEKHRNATELRNEQIVEE